MIIIIIIIVIIMIITITNYTRFYIDHTAESLLCRMCRSKGEAVAHVMSECGKTEYKGRHDNAARFIHCHHLVVPQAAQAH